MDLYLLVIALGSAILYAAGNMATRHGVQYSTPITMTYISFATQTVILWVVVFFTGGIPEVSPLAVFLGVVVGLFMPIIRLLTYIGIAKIGSARAASLRSTYPFFSGILAVSILREEINRAIIAGTILVVVGVILICCQTKDRLLPFQRMHVLFPLTAAILAGVVHPIVRYALEVSNSPLFFSALVGLVSLLTFLTYQALTDALQRPIWNPKGLAPFIAAGLCETFGFLLFTAALGVGPVVLVSPMIATTPMWVLLGTALIMQDVEQLNYRTVLGTCPVVAGTVAISLGK